MLEVYCATSPSGKRYVGFTSRGVRKRWAEHVREAHRGGAAPLHRAIRKYGGRAFTRALLERMATEAGAKRAEQLWIAELGTYGAAGYNSTLGGEGALGHRHSPEVRAKITAAQIGRPSGMLGKTHSAEARMKISASQMGRAPTKGMSGRKHSAETRAKMRSAATGRDTSRAVTAHQFNARQRAEKK